MMEKFYTTSNFIAKKYLNSVPESDLGFDYNGQHIEIGDNPYEKSSAGPVLISDLIQNLHVLKNNGANYVSCDWHCDHGELVLYGFSMTVSTSEEIESYLDVLKTKSQKTKENEIANLEKKLILLKKDLEVNK